jgi:hypothetical protein
MHQGGRDKARGFDLLLGITLEAIDYLEAEIRSGVRGAPVSTVRPNPLPGFNCVVELTIQGVGVRSGVSATVRTVWGIAAPDTKPWLVTAFPRGLN